MTTATAISFGSVQTLTFSELQALTASLTLADLHASLESRIERRHVRGDNGRLNRTDVEIHYIVFTGGKFGEHRVAADVSDKARILAHWGGYCSANSVGAADTNPSAPATDKNTLWRQYYAKPTRQNFAALVASLPVFSAELQMGDVFTTGGEIWKLQGLGRSRYGIFETCRARRFNRSKRAFNTTNTTMRRPRG